MIGDLCFIDNEGNIKNFLNSLFFNDPLAITWL